MASRNTVAAGERYRDLQRGMFGRPGKAWLVTGLLTGRDGLAYAQLVAELDHTDKRTLSVSALADRGRFERIEA
jgi:hypothetical protein